jgi:hypothetical protein
MQNSNDFILILTSTGLPPVVSFYARALPALANDQLT